MGVLCLVWLNWIRVFKYEVKNVKSLHTDEQTDAGWKVICKIHSKFQLRWAKKKKAPQSVIFCVTLTQFTIDITTCTITITANKQPTDIIIICIQVTGFSCRCLNIVFSSCPFAVSSKRISMVFLELYVKSYVRNKMKLT